MAKTIGQVIREDVLTGFCDPSCEVCKGQGYIRYDFPTHDRRFGKLYPCPKRMKAHLAENGAGGLDADEVRELSWDKVYDGISHGHRARDAGMELFEKGYGLLFLYGSYGQGKTLVLKIGVASALRKGIPAAYANMSGILDDIRSAFDATESRGTELSRRMDKWMGVDVLAIDELDKANQTQWAREKIHQLLDLRYTRAVRQEAITMVAANLGEGFDSLDGYLASRLRDNRVGTLVQLNGPDGRTVIKEGWRW